MESIQAIERLDPQTIAAVLAGRFLAVAVKNRRRDEEGDAETTYMAQLVHVSVALAQAIRRDLPLETMPGLTLAAMPVVEAQERQKWITPEQGRALFIEGIDLLDSEIGAPGVVASVPPRVVIAGIIAPLTAAILRYPFEKDPSEVLAKAATEIVVAAKTLLVAASAGTDSPTVLEMTRALAPALEQLYLRGVDEMKHHLKAAAPDERKQLEAREAPGMLDGIFEQFHRCAGVMAAVLASVPTPDDVIVDSAEAEATDEEPEEDGAGGEGE